MLDLLALTAFAGCLIYAAFSDVATLTIPNWVSVAMAAVFPAAALARGMPLGDIGVHLAFGVAVLAVGFFLFQANIFGGGDAKLLAAAAIWTGSAAFVPFLFGTAVAGGLLAIALLAARQFIKPSEAQPSFVTRLLKQQEGIPYGLAIMAGGLMALPALPFTLSPLTLP
jgi:prepilin peptidase CpaA